MTCPLCHESATFQAFSLPTGQHALFCLLCRQSHVSRVWTPPAPRVPRCASCHAPVPADGVRCDECEAMRAEYAMYQESAS